MNIKSLLLGSAAALAVVSGAQAADAIVAAEPEPMEYVRVCDAFGTGYFYIPGTETCLKIGGEVRATLDFDSSAEDTVVTPATATTAATSKTHDNDWNSAIRARLNITAKSDSELGTVTSFIRLQGTDSGDVSAQQAYIQVGGFKAGLLATFWDDIDPAGESEYMTDDTTWNAISYTYTSDAFSAGLGIDDTSEASLTNDVAIEAFASAKFGVVSVAAYGLYETEYEDGAIYATVSAEIGPGAFEVSGLYTTYDEDVDSDFIASLPGSGVDTQWNVVAAYSFKATEKLSIAPTVTFMEDLAGTSAWGAGIYGEYKLAEGLKASAHVDYLDEDGQDELWTGYVRLTRSF
jgi:Porin subfamily